MGLFGQHLGNLRFELRLAFFQLSPHVPSQHCRKLVGIRAFVRVGDLVLGELEPAFEVLEGSLRLLHRLKLRVCDEVAELIELIFCFQKRAVGFLLVLGNRLRELLDDASERALQFNQLGIDGLALAVLQTLELGFQVLLVSLDLVVD